MGNEVLVEIDDGIVTITLNRPDNLNALSTDMFEVLLTQITELSSNKAARVIVLTGAGRAFCAGGDVKAMKGNAAELSYDERVAILRRKSRIVELIHEMPQVTIAMVNGVAAGAGFSLALACDLRVAAQSAKFTTAFAKVGFSGDYGGTYFLSKIVGTAKARELYLTGDKLGADEALKLGIVSHVFDDSALKAKTMSLARTFSNGPMLAYTNIKRNFICAETGDLTEILDLEARNQIQLALSEDHMEAIRAFREKREPRFQGR